MARVSITINGRTYDIACSDGEEQHILDLAEVVDAKVGELVKAIGQAGEARLLAMAGLLFADELTEAKDHVLRLQADLAAAQEALQNVPEPAPIQAAPQPSLDEDRLAQILDAMASRIETIADGLESA